MKYIVFLLIITFSISIYLLYNYLNKEKKYNKVCIFDIDNTLTHGSKADEKNCKVKFNDNIQPGYPINSGSNNAIYSILNKCKKEGYGIAIATARSGINSNNSQLKNYLYNLDPTIFNEKFFNSPKFQNSCSIVKSYNKDGIKFCEKNNHGDKAAMYYNIMNYYNIPPTEWKNSIIFDDDKKHIDTANRLTFKTCQASKECNGNYCDLGCGLNFDCLNII